MSYVNIDPIIDTWAKGREVLVLQEDQEPRRRFFYVSSDKGETFQFVIEPERSQSVRIDAHLIETWDNSEEHYVWETPVSELAEVLEVGLGMAKNWFNRNVQLR